MSSYQFPVTKDQGYCHEIIKLLALETGKMQFELGLILRPATIFTNNLTHILLGNTNILSLLPQCFKFQRRLVG